VLEHWDSMYGLSLGEIPWEIGNTPPELIALMDKIVCPENGTALDIGCGTGNYSTVLARKGYRVTGVDCSPQAIKIGNTRNLLDCLPIHYFEMNALDLAERFAPQQRFDFILDYSFLHHLPPERLNLYATQCAGLLAVGGYLLIVCYSEHDHFADGKETARGAYGNQMWYRSRAVIERAYFQLRLDTYYQTKLGKNHHHHAHCFVFRKCPPREGPFNQG
jgi:SAM-dependent methyltransferase